jgi:YHS domain-containing protein
MRTDGSGPSATHQGTTYYFCSRTCKQAFENQPDAYGGERSKIADETDHGHAHDHH